MWLLNTEYDGRIAVSTLQDEESEVSMDDMLSMFEPDVRVPLARRLRGLRALGANTVQLEYARDMFSRQYQGLEDPRPSMSNFVGTFFDRRLQDLMRTLEQV